MIEVILFSISVVSVSSVAFIVGRIYQFNISKEKEMTVKFWPWKIRNKNRFS